MWTMSPFLFLISIISIVCVTIVTLAVILKGKSTRKQQEADADETQLIQQMHQNLNSLEDRMEALETIILDMERRKGNLK